MECRACRYRAGFLPGGGTDGAVITMSAILASPAVLRPPHRTAAPVHAPQPWLVGPWFDLAFVANVGWPLIVGAIVAWGPEFQTGVTFWQLYFVSTPHRWITILIVLLDRSRAGNRHLLFLAIAAAVLLICATVQLTTGTLTCLL